MKIVDACGAFLTHAIVREAIKGLPKHAVARLHVCQEMMWENSGIVVTSIVSAPHSSGPDFFKHFPKPTLGGHVIVLDLWFPLDRIRFEVDGEPVVGIVNLHVPEEAQ